MIEKNGEQLNIQDNFLPEIEFGNLRDVIMGEQFPWFYSSKIVDGSDTTESPGQLVHIIYNDNTPQSQFYESDMFIPIRNQLRIGLLIRIKMNLRLRLPEPFESGYHTDTEYLPKDLAVKYTTSILYLNTCNGYTEFKDGTKVDSVANRIVNFPSSMMHRGTSCTDSPVRIVINLNYLKQSAVGHGRWFESKR